MTETTESPLLAVDHVSTRFETTRGMLHAVDDVSFDLAAGATLGVVGESGSGKSMLARAVMGLLPERALRSGAVRFEGRDLWTMPTADARTLWGSEISIVLQNPSTSLNPVIRVGKQITESLMLHRGLRGETAKARALQLLEQVGIPEPARRFRAYPIELSGGMRQRISIAIAIACGPKLLLADEPTTALDVTIQRQILDLLKSLQHENNMAMILISHDLGVVARRTDRIIVMYGGRVMESGPTAALFRSTRHPYTTSLLSSIPHLTARSHTRLAVIPGRPVDVIDPQPGCRFAPRCLAAQERCTQETPPLTAAEDPGHAFACFYPSGTEIGERALEANLSVGHTATGLAVDGPRPDALVPSIEVDA